MVFSSLLFLFLYLPIVLAVYSLIPAKWRNIWLFIVNLVFYGWGEPVYILLMLFSIAINYAAGLLVERYHWEKKKARRVLAGNIVINLSLLGFFKYYGLFARTLNLIPGLNLPVLSLTLPIGISFYTFQTMSYPIDLYRRDCKLQRNFITFGTFVALFPQLIAGPIVRYKDVADQLAGRSRSPEQFASGVRRFAAGLGKKVLLANNVGMLWDVYSAKSVGELTVLGSWLGIIAFSMQIYFDFSGYSDMAIGLGRMLGFEFLENFNYPYIARSVTDFWRRWHISLSSWFRDYVYIPLGGNRKGLKRQIFNLFVVWSLTGFWHGANWNFLGWGIYYFLLLMLEKAFLLKILEKLPAFVGHLYAVVAAVCGWVMFDLESLGHIGGYYKAMFGFAAGGGASAGDLFYLRDYLLVLLIGALACTPVSVRLWKRIPAKAQPYAAPVLILAVMVLSTAYLVDSTYNPFLYFRF